MNFVYLNATTAQFEGTPAESIWVQKQLTHVDPQSDVTTCIYDAFRGVLPIGIVPLLAHTATQMGMAATITDPIGPKLPRPICDTEEAARALGIGWLYDYQRSTVHRLVRDRFGIARAPTGSGKTEIGAGLIQVIPANWLVLAHKKHLVQQFADRVAKRIGRPLVWLRDILDGKRDLPPAPWLIGETFQTCKSRLTEALPILREVTGFIADECHTVAARTFQQVIEQLVNALYRIGLTGTPMEQGDLRSLLVSGHIGPIRIRIRTKTLIERGHLSRAKIRFVPVEHAGPQNSTWHGVFREQIVWSPARRAAVKACMAAAVKPCMVFVGDIKHGQMLQTVQDAESLGFSVAKVDGQITRGRQQIIDDMNVGRYDVLVTTEVFQEGVDIPELASVVVATGEKSVVATMQRVGRGMRVTKTKREFEVWDLFDYVFLGGSRLAPTSWRWCENHSRERAQALIEDDHEVFVGEPGDPNPIPYQQWSNELRQRRRKDW